MFTSFASLASSYFYLPIDEEINTSDDSPLDPSQKHISWLSSDSLDHDDDDSSSTSTSSSCSSINVEYEPPPTPPPRKSSAVIKEVLAQDDLYKVLGIQRSTHLDRLTLRRAYLSRSKACHPDKFPGSAEATEAFQKVAVAYDVLSKPSSKRMYDSRPTSYDFTAHPCQRAEETFRSVVLGVFNDFLDGDLETVRTLLRAVNDLNPALRLGDDGINTVLLTLESIRQRALTCRICILTLNSELSRILEVQYAFRQLSYFDLRRRSRLTIELVRIAISLPVTLDKALQRQKPRNGVGGVETPDLVDDRDHNPPLAAPTSTTTVRGANTALLNRRVYRLLSAFAIVLERMEKIL